MAFVFAVSPAEEWPRDWQLRPYELHRVLSITPERLADVNGAVVLVPRPLANFREAIRAVEEVRHDTNLAVLLADHADVPGVADLMLAHEFDGFLDLDWPSHLARAAIDSARRNVELGRNIVEIQRAVLEQTRQETAELYQQALLDDLTQLYNHRHFVSLIEREHRRCMTLRRPYGLVFIDLDNLKELNTLHGHEGGSQALRHLARILRESSAADDVAVRVGGDEFAMLLCESNPESALARAEQVCRAVSAEPLVMNGKRVSLSISAGVAAFPEDGFTSNDMLRRADEALLWAKAHGKNRAVPWRMLTPAAAEPDRRAS
jgi:diguanylate cyclase (GGDEF)-like protein